MQAEIRFGHIIHTSMKAQPAFPAFIETVEQAIDHIQELPRWLLGHDHWNTAFLALWEAADFPTDSVKLAAAAHALCAALSAEGWLEQVRPV